MGSPLRGCSTVQEPRGGWGIPGKGMGPHISHMAKGSRKAPMLSPTGALWSSGRMML